MQKTQIIDLAYCKMEYLTPTSHRLPYLDAFEKLVCKFDVPFLLLTNLGMVEIFNKLLCYFKWVSKNIGYNYK